MGTAVAEEAGAWVEHALGDAGLVWAVARRAVDTHAAAAGDRLKADGNELFAAARSGAYPVAARCEAEAAILRWRAALWLQLDVQGDLSACLSWRLLDLRHRCWQVPTPRRCCR